MRGALCPAIWWVLTAGTGIYGNVISQLPGTLSAELDRIVLRVRVLDQGRDMLAELDLLKSVVLFMMLELEKLALRWWRKEHDSRRGSASGVKS